MLALVLGALAALIVTGRAAAYEQPVRVNEVAMAYSLGVGEVRCPSQNEWDADFGSAFGYAYTNLVLDYTVLSPVVCAGAVGVGSAAVPDWQQALGVLVLVHESFHLRHWRWRRDESRVECQALIYFREAATRLGASAVQAYALYAYAIALHRYKAGIFPQYRVRGCPYTQWIPPQ